MTIDEYISPIIHLLHLLFLYYAVHVAIDTGHISQATADLFDHDAMASRFKIRGIQLLFY